MEEEDSLDAFMSSLDAPPLVSSPADSILAMRRVLEETKDKKRKEPHERGVPASDEASSSRQRSRLEERNRRYLEAAKMVADGHPLFSDQAIQERAPEVWAEFMSQALPEEPPANADGREKPTLASAGAGSSAPSSPGHQTHSVAAPAPPSTPSSSIPSDLVLGGLEDDPSFATRFGSAVSLDQPLSSSSSSQFSGGHWGESLRPSKSLSSSGATVTGTGTGSGDSEAEGVLVRRTALAAQAAAFVASQLAPLPSQPSLSSSKAMIDDDDDATDIHANDAGGWGDVSVAPVAQGGALTETGSARHSLLPSSASSSGHASSASVPSASAAVFPPESSSSFAPSTSTGGSATSSGGDESRGRRHQALLTAMIGRYVDGTDVFIAQQTNAGVSSSSFSASSTSSSSAMMMGVEEQEDEGDAFRLHRMKAERQQNDEEEERDDDYFK